MKLFIKSTGRTTNAFHKLCAACAPHGAMVVKRGRGFDDNDIIQALATDKLIKVRQSGPRGGRRWHATKKGRKALAVAIDATKEK